MSTTPQMSQQQYGQPQYGQPQSGQQPGFPQQQGSPQGQQQGPNTSPPQIQQQLQQLGQQQPFQQLLQQMGQQMGGMQQTEQPLVLPSAIEAASVTSGIATKFWDVVTPLPGQPSILYLFINNNWHPLANPTPVTHDAVQQAFAYGQQVIGFFDTKTGAIQAVVVNRQ
ncbi:hypothetical protein [Streptomyces sp. BPTC-684]|uniref:hypothetical protein n=1 Tax=Streptomyces sp. BPTC-684 TaxID=3043734 RepID=UPI0024B18A43|nr:hypothetical protein [Streptomyces sp. BPTC-684]WHM39524.1 hypothetical protein QIY60_23615 [Streptomyces sp. BPTC-684]